MEATLVQDKTKGAFFGSEALKSEYLSILQKHYDADEIIHGIYWENGKGCAVGCTVKNKTASNMHLQLQKELNIPEQLWRLEDNLFERQTNGDSKEWPLRFLKAIKVGSKPIQAFYKFQIWIYEDLKENITKDYDYVTKVLQTAIDYYIQLASGGTITKEQWDELWNDAAYAAYAADAARAARAAYAADAARAADAAYAAYAADAARAADAAYAAYAADAAYAARAAYAAYAAYAADAARAAYAADAAESKKQTKRQADKLIELLAECE